MKHNFTSSRLASTVMRLAVCAAAGLAVQTAAAQTVDRDANRPVRDRDRAVTVETRERDKLKNPDRNFVEKVMRMSMDNVEISRVAMERSSNPRVRALADVMASDHASLSKELGALASDKGVTLPAKDMVGDKWVKRAAKDFDAEYLKKVVSDHEETVKLFQKQARDGHDPELVAFARKHLATLQHHLQEADDLHKLMK